MLICEEDIHTQWRGFFLCIFDASYILTSLGASMFERAQWVLVQELSIMVSTRGLLLQEFSYRDQFGYMQIYPFHLLCWIWVKLGDRFHVAQSLRM